MQMHVSLLTPLPLSLLSLCLCSAFSITDAVVVVVVVVDAVVVVRVARGVESVCVAGGAVESANASNSNGLHPFQH